MAIHPDDVMLVIDLLRRWIGHRAGQEALDWLNQVRDRILDGADDRFFFQAFTVVPRHIGKIELALAPDDLKQADAARTGWEPARWTTDQAARTVLLLSVDDSEPVAYRDKVTHLLQHGEIGAMVALLQALPLLPYPDRHRDWAMHGGQSTIAQIFAAIALHNPYPSEQFDDSVWNQMILKAVFLGSPLHAIQGLDRRANHVLAHLLRDYAHACWSAHRMVTPELWRPVGPFADGAVLGDLEKLLRDRDPTQREAAALALAQSPEPAAGVILSRQPELQRAIAEGRLTWDSFSRERLKNAA